MKKIVQNIVKYENSLDLNNPVPKIVNIEVTNICDLRCIMCKRVERPKGYIPLDLLRDFLPEAKQLGVEQAGLFTVGEPILHPEFADIIRLCKAQDVYTYIDVNGNSLTEEKARKIVESGLDSLKFSIAAADEETYKRVHGGGSFAKVCENIRRVRRIRDEQHSPMRVSASFIIMQETQQQLPAFKRVMKELVDELHYDVVNNVAHRIDDKAFEDMAINDFDIPCESGICSSPWNRMVLSWDGYLSCCCIDYELDINLGHYRKGNLAGLFYGEKAQHIRNAMRERRYEDLPDICRGCQRLRYDMAERSKQINTRFQ